jgi:SMI1-KNR4 cell-wall
MIYKKLYDIDFTEFWEKGEYSTQNYIEEPLSRELLASIEKEIGYKLPESYVELMSIQNGGVVTKTCFPTEEASSWSADHIAITGIFGIGRSKTYSLCGKLGSKFMIEEWGYPEIGICICDCPSAGHDMVMLDYTKCGRSGEPEVVHVDQECDFNKTFLAKDFESFIRGLVSPEVYDTTAEDLKQANQAIQSGSFSSIMREFFRAESDSGFERILRNLLSSLTEKKGYFALHGDDISHLVYDVQFYLFSRNRGVCNEREYLEAYPSMIAFSDGAISTKGYAPGFVEDWLAQRISSKQIDKRPSGRLEFSGECTKELLEKLNLYRA